MKIAICFLTTKENPFSLDLLKKQIQESKQHNIDLYVYIDNKGDYNRINNKIYFNYQYFRDKFNYQHYYTNVSSSVNENSGMQFLPFLDMYIKHINQYDMYMFYEDDTIYFGKENLFDSLNFNCDALFQDKRKLVTEDNWMWWFDSEHYIDLSIIKTLYHGLLNIYALNSIILKNLISFINSGNYVHHEMLISAFVLNNNYKVHYIDNYIPSYMSFEDNANITDKYTLIHPVKTFEKYQLIKSQFKYGS